MNGRGKRGTARIPRLSIATFLLLPSLVAAQSIVTSDAPQSVSVSIYRNSEGSIDLKVPGQDPEEEDPEPESVDQLRERLGGFALISETRVVNVPAGESTVRFENVAEGIVPVTALITGLPGGVIEKNRDASLLSPASLVDGTLGRRVHLKRTNRKTGKVTEEDATIIAGPGGGVVLRTKHGIERLGCSGLDESLSYDKLPEGLTAKPTLSVKTRSPTATTATVTLSYIADFFDWRANYIVDINPDGKTLTLFAWMTLANGNGQSFVNAQTSGVAGKLEVDKEAGRDEGNDLAPELSLQCQPIAAAPAVKPVGVMGYGGGGDGGGDGEIVVTAQRRYESLMQAVPVTALTADKAENLGDLKLYRIPERVTVAAKSQKQVALLQKKKVPFEQIYTFNVNVDDDFSEPKPASIVFRMKNVEKKGLGLPLPAGKLNAFQAYGEGPRLVGTGGFRDYAVGEDIDLRLGQSSQVQLRAEDAPENPKADDDADRHIYALTNANPFSANVEIYINVDEDWKIIPKKGKIGKKWGKPVWFITVPANGSVKLEAKIIEIDDEKK